MIQLALPCAVVSAVGAIVSTISAVVSAMGAVDRVIGAVVSAMSAVVSAVVSAIVRYMPGHTDKAEPKFKNRGNRTHTE